MNTKICLVFFLMIFLAGSILAADWPICIDTKAPSAPTNLRATGNLELSWTASTDTPDCSGIFYYKIYKGTVFLGVSGSTSYSGSALPDGTYTLGVSAVDKGKNEGEKATITVTFPLGTTENPPSNPPSGGGGGGGGSGGGGGGGGGSTTQLSSSSDEESCIENWQCADWSNLEEECGTRSCNDLNKCGTSQLKPQTSKKCSSTSLFGITGGAIGALGDFAKTGAGVASIAVIIAIIAVGIAIPTIKKRQRKNKKS